MRHSVISSAAIHKMDDLIKYPGLKDQTRNHNIPPRCGSERSYRYRHGIHRRRFLKQTHCFFANKKLNKPYRIEGHNRFSFNSYLFCCVFNVSCESFLKACPFDRFLPMDDFCDYFYGQICLFFVIPGFFKICVEYDK